MEDALVFIFTLIYALVPVALLLRCFQAIDKRIRACRIRYAIPSLLLTLINIGTFLYHWFVQKVPFFRFDNLTFLLPALALLLVLIIWNAGRRKEKIIQAEITSDEIEKVRFQKWTNHRQQITVTSSDEDELL